MGQEEITVASSIRYQCQNNERREEAKLIAEVKLDVATGFYVTPEGRRFTHHDLERIAEGDVPNGWWDKHKPPYEEGFLPQSIPIIVPYFCELDSKPEIAELLDIDGDTPMYRLGDQLFDFETVRRIVNHMQPADWWNNYGALEHTEYEENRPWNPMILGVDGNWHDRVIKYRNRLTKREEELVLLGIQPCIKDNYIVMYNTALLGDNHVFTFAGDNVEQLREDTWPLDKWKEYAKRYNMEVDISDREHQI